VEVQDGLGAATTDPLAPVAADFRLTRWLFLRLLGIVYLAAFASLWVQVDGLLGSRGVLPVSDFLTTAHHALGQEAYWRLPTLCWLCPGDNGLQALCAAGVALSVLLILGLAPGPILAALWACYLSATNVGQAFFTYQWDTLLLETGLLAIFFAPWGVWPRPASESAGSPAVRWLLRWLLFRLVFSSGVAKLVSGDPSWRDLTALAYHYETQPLPTWTSWYMHQMPLWFHQVSALLTLILEIAVPPFLFVGTRCRHRAAFAMTLLQVLILLTGNYGFFNLLTIALCVAQLDDDVLPISLRRRLLPTQPIAATERWRRIALLPITGTLLLLSFVPFFSTLHRGGIRHDWLAEPFEIVDAFHLANSYGLFAIMTTERREIVIEGSDDGQTWTEYAFRWKPGDVQRRPQFATPHLPRLDWQMWFAALGTCEENLWFQRFLARLLEGEPAVLAQLQENPFPDRSPRFVRARLYRYRFTDGPTRAGTGAWWQRELLGPYSPVLSRDVLR
jgi:hypothetical protein